MGIDEALEGVSRLFLDTAPIIYFVERTPQFVALVDPVFDRLDEDITSVIEPVTLAECLLGPIRSDLAELEQAYLTLLSTGQKIKPPLKPLIFGWWGCAPPPKN